MSGKGGVGSGAGDRNRTYDLRVTSALLYRLSYTGLSGDGAKLALLLRASNFSLHESFYYIPGQLGGVNSADTEAVHAHEGVIFRVIVIVLPSTSGGALVIVQTMLPAPVAVLPSAEMVLQFAVLVLEPSSETSEIS